MDRDLLTSLRKEGERAVYFWDLLPDAREEKTDPPLARWERLKWMTRLRTTLFARLAAAGVDFLHSDADALWQRDPRPWLREHMGFDLLFSQGTTHPSRHHWAAGFTVCAGFFFARASARTAAFFEEAERMATREASDDQSQFNRLLRRRLSGRWEMEAPRLAIARSRGRVASTDEVTWSWRYAEGAWIRALGTRALREWWLRYLAHGALRAGGRKAMVTSAKVMTGRLDDGLTVGVIPMRLVERVPLADRGDVLVSHLAEVRRRWVTVPLAPGGGGVAIEHP